MGRPPKVVAEIIAPTSEAIITWLGNDDDQTEVVWKGVTFPKGKPVMIDDPWMIQKATGNALFEVET